jgi:hypothetical protein
MSVCIAGEDQAIYIHLSHKHSVCNPKIPHENSTHTFAYYLGIHPSVFQRFGNGASEDRFIAIKKLARGGDMPVIADTVIDEM